MTRPKPTCPRCGELTIKKSGFAWCRKCDEPVRNQTYEAIDSSYYINSVGLSSGGRRKLMAKTGFD